LEDLLIKMNPEKRNKLINAALTEFGSNSYEKASTNTIVKNAGISKGLLYHYFHNKEELYNYLVKFFYERTMLDIIENIDYNETDILERIIKTVEYKIKIFKKYPGLISFSKGFYAGKSIEELKADINDYAPGYYERFYRENVDYSRFKTEFDIQTILNITQFTMEKLSETYLRVWTETGILELDNVKAELDKYLETFKTAFYQ
jgi:TetR/AcrR family transcriptional regulator